MIKNNAIVTVESPLNLTDIDPTKLKYIQFNKPLLESEYQQLAQFLKSYPNVILRVFGDYNQDIKNLEFLTYFSNHLHIEIDLFHLEDIQGFQYLNSNMKHVGFAQTKKKHSLSFLNKFANLESLYIEKHTKNIEVVSQLTNLRELTLRSVTLPNLEILLSLHNLKSFDVKLGGSTDLSLLPSVGQIEYLELWMIRGL